MAKRTKSVPTWMTPRFQGRKVLVAGQPRGYVRRELAEQIEREGGKVVGKVTKDLDYVLVVNARGTPAAVKEAEKLNRRGAAIEVLDRSAFDAKFLVSPDEARAMLTGGKAGLDCWRRLYPNGPANPIDLAGTDLRGRRLSDRVCLYRVNLDGANLGGADLSHSYLGELKGVDLTAARMRWTKTSGFNACTLRDADLTEAHLNPTTFEGCDARGARFHKAFGSYTVARDSDFGGADFSQAELDGSQFESTELGKADFSEAVLRECDFTAGRLRGAVLRGADLTRAKLAGADLSGADLRGADLADADLSGAAVDGADFTGANLLGANLTGVRTAKAKGIDLDALQIGAAGPKVLELEAVAGQAKSFFFHADLDVPKGCVAVDVRVGSGRCHPTYIFYTLGERDVRYADGEGKSVSEAMLRAAKKWGKTGTLRLDEFKVEAKGCPVSPAAAKELVIDAWCEAMGTDRAGALAAQTATLSRNRDAWVARWRTGPAGVKAWNQADTVSIWRAGSFEGIDAAGMKLDGIRFFQLILARANFRGAKLRKASIQRCDCRQADFSGCDLSASLLHGSRFNGADLSRAVLAKSNLTAADLTGASLGGADLSGAELRRADLRGADLSGATLGGADWEDAVFDEKTCWPDGYRIPAALKWKGKGVRPTTYRNRGGESPSAATRAPAPIDSIDFDTFMRRLDKKADGGKVAKAIAMLKADRFRLFAQVMDDGVAGVVKSQTDADLVYACRLDDEGRYACCTQNLRPCGGLQGSACKHLLVLLIGLAKSGELAPALADSWIDAGRRRNAELDKEKMGEIFIRYKGAEAGEVDWRPTETVPEDYYAL